VFEVGDYHIAKRVVTHTPHEAGWSAQPGNPGGHVGRRTTGLDGDFAGGVTTGQEQCIGLHEHIPDQITDGDDCPLTHGGFLLTRICTEYT
jgi:hypothetical protein